MVQRIRCILTTICLVVLFFMALLLLFQMSPWVPLSNFGSQILGSIPTSVQVLILLAAIAMVVVIGVLWARSLREEVLITKTGEEGSVTIVESAIVRYIKQVALEMESVQSVRAHIANTAQGLVVEMFVNVLVTETLPRIEQTIRARVREALEQTLGVGGVAAINVVVENFEKVAAKAEPPAEVSTVKLTGESAAGQGAETEPKSWARLFRRSEAENGKSGSAEQAPDTDTGQRGN
jgi:uncharacterized alkaline shock family protein YloU